MTNTFPEYVRCIDADGHAGLTNGRVYPVHAYDVSDDFYTILNDQGRLQGNYGFRFEPVTEEDFLKDILGDLGKDEDEDDIYEAADIEAEKARMSPEALDGPLDGPFDPVEDLIDEPAHYARWEIEPITYIMRNRFEFWRGNIVKYASRAGFKAYPNMTTKESEITDLQKVIRYAAERIAQLEIEGE